MKLINHLFAMLVVPSAMLSAQTLTTLHSFTFGEGSPIGGFALSGNVLYGTASSGANAVLFSINTNGTGFTETANLYNQGVATPLGNLALTNGTLFGTSLNDTIYSINTNGQDFSLIHAFSDNPYGTHPYGKLSFSGDKLYGTTFQDGLYGYGTIFSLSVDGSSFNVLHDFAESPDGAFPASSVIISGDTIYGTTWQGGSDGLGTVFSMKSDGSDYTVLHDFTNSPDGILPVSGLTLASNVLYGTTSQGGDSGYGIVFSLNTDGSNYKVIYSFSLTNGDAGVPGKDGNLLLSGSILYGAVFDHGGYANGSGLIYSLYTDGGGFNVLHRFTLCDADNHGTNADGAVLWANDLVMSGHTLFGTTTFGGNGDGTNGYGTVFALQFPAPQPEINKIEVSTNNGVTISCSGGIGFPYIIQAATNLALSPITWVAISTNTPDANGHWQFTDSLTNGGVFSSWRTNLLYSGGSINPLDPRGTNVLGTNVTFDHQIMRFYRAATMP